MSVALDSALRTRTVAVNGQPCRVWEKGEGAPLVFLAGFGGLPRWTECLDQLAARRRVIAPSLPGFPGSDAIGPLTPISIGCSRLATSLQVQALSAAT